jgi:hypothetical protein
MDNTFWHALNPHGRCYFLIDSLKYKPLIYIEANRKIRSIFSQ